MEGKGFYDPIIIKYLNMETFGETKKKYVMTSKKEMISKADWSLFRPHDANCFLFPLTNIDRTVKKTNKTALVKHLVLQLHGENRIS